MVRLVAPTALIEDEHVGSYPMKVELLALVRAPLAPQVRTNRDVPMPPDFQVTNRRVS
jgi:hypothetical protein